MSDDQLNSVQLAVFQSRLSAICDEMGEVLRRSAFSPNIKDRLDYSCAVFDCDGRIMAQAAHIPVHLGSMAYAMKGLVASQQWYEGDILILNDPYEGGTHLPDVTVISPVYHLDELVGFLACRAHHANIGCDEPGSMPLSSSLDEEGVIISPVKLFLKGQLQEDVVSFLSQIEGEACTLPGDFKAQLSAVQSGNDRICHWLRSGAYSVEKFNKALTQLNEYGARLAREYFAELPEGEVFFEDFLDDDGYGSGLIKVALNLKVSQEGVMLDFSESADQVAGNLNCPESVCAAAVYYVFASLLPDYVPHCDGVFSLIKLKTRKGSVLNALPGAAVASGNVETSMRVVDVVMGALNRLGVKTAAASQGTMNNVAMGHASWSYYETLGGGAGGSPFCEGLSAVQCHMTNSLNTPVESFEMHFPVRIESYQIRRGSGGGGANKGGDGIVRSYVFNSPARLTVLSERRLIAPWGMQGGDQGEVGKNFLNGVSIPGKAAFNIESGDNLVICTPGGGGWGKLV